MPDVNANKWRVVKVLEQHRNRLATYSGKEQTEAGDLVAGMLLRYFDRIGLLDQVEKLWHPELRRRLGKSPLTNYHKEHPNAALRKLCDMAADMAKAEGSGYTLMIVPEELLEILLLDCEVCGRVFSAKRATRKTCRGKCKTQKSRAANVSKRGPIANRPVDTSTCTN